MNENSVYPNLHASNLDYYVCVSGTQVIIISIIISIFINNNQSLLYSRAATTDGWPLRCRIDWISGETNNGEEGNSLLSNQCINQRESENKQAKL